VYLQGFIVGKKFVMKEMVMLRKGVILSHYIFTCPISWNFLIKLEKYYFMVSTSWLSAYHHGIAWEDEIGKRNDPVRHSEISDYNGYNWCRRE